MRRVKIFATTLGLCGSLVLAPEQAAAADIRGTISSTLTITEDSQLTGDVTCRVAGAACIAFGAPGISLRLNGFAVTGQGDAITGCSGSQVAGEHGIMINGLRGAIIQGPGAVQRFRAHGIIITGASSRGTRDASDPGHQLLLGRHRHRSVQRQRPGGEYRRRQREHHVALRRHMTGRRRKPEPAPCEPVERKWIRSAGEQLRYRPGQPRHERQRHRR